MNAPANPNKALWEKGDFTRIADTMRESGEALVQRLGITKGLKVLDLGCGDGTTALPAAKLGADVLGIDIARNLVEAGNRRAEEHGLTNLKFQEGDASNLEQVPDKSFDLVVSIFGAMFAPKPFDVAKEMVRVTRPGGRIVMGNWIPNDPTLVAQILKISSNYTPPPPEGFVSPMTWGVESNVIERFTAAGIPKENISFARDTFTFNFPGTPSQFVDAFRKYYGPTMNAFEAAEKQGRAAELQKQLEELFNSQNKGQEGTSIPATFLRVTVGESKKSIREVKCSSFAERMISPDSRSPGNSSQSLPRSPNTRHRRALVADDVDEKIDSARRSRIHDRVLRPINEFASMCLQVISDFISAFSGDFHLRNFTAVCGPNASGVRSPEVRLKQPPLQRSIAQRHDELPGKLQVKEKSVRVPPNTDTRAFAEATAAKERMCSPISSFTATASMSGFVWLFLALRLSLGRRRAITSTLHLRMVLGGHFLLLMLPAHLLLMMQRTHLLLVMLSGHLLLMMLSIHLLLMIHRLLPMSRAFVLDSFVVGPRLVSLNVVIVAVKIFSLVFVPVILGPKFLGVFFTAHSCSLAVMFSEFPVWFSAFPAPAP